MQNVTTFVLGGGRGTRLYPLTKYRSKPAVPLAGKYRLIDIPLSNCINSGINRIFVLTQFMSVSLHRHIRQTYRFDPFNGGFVELLAAQQTMDTGTDWYQGTADAVRKNLRYIQQPGIEYVLILSGDQLYRMDFRQMLRAHRESDADVTIAGIPVSAAAAKSLGIMRVDNSGRVVGFLEKPQTQEEVNLVRMDAAWFDRQGVQPKDRDCVANMGIYLFNRETLEAVLDKTNYQDFGKEVFPASIRARRVRLHLFDDYWEDIGTIRAFYEANLELCQAAPAFRLTTAEAPIYSRARFLPPTLLTGATVRNSLIADGCQIGDGTVIENSVIGLRCIVGPGTTIRNSIIMGADYYETGGQLDDDRSAGRPPAGIGAGSVIEGAILDKNCGLGPNSRIVNQAGVVDSEDAAAVMIRDGIPVVLKDARLPEGYVL